MMIVYTEFAHLTQMLTEIVKKATDFELEDVAVELEDYIEQIVRLHVIRCRYPAMTTHHQFLLEYVSDNPLTSLSDANNYYQQQQFELLLRATNSIWCAVAEDMYFLPRSDFLLWHVGNGVWKLLTTGVSYND